VHPTEAGRNWTGQPVAGRKNLPVELLQQVRRAVAPGPLFRPNPDMPIPAPLDLFHYEGRTSARERRPRPLPPRLPSAEQLATLSDQDLSDLSALVLDELHRRVSADSGNKQSGLDAAVGRAATVVASLRPRRPKARPSGKEGPSIILDGKRNAIRAALNAGLKPTQVAKHFGVTLADVRQVASRSV
jgi:hypothetical protein